MLADYNDPHTTNENLRSHATTHAIILQNSRPVQDLVVSLPNTTQPLWSTLLTKLTCLLQQKLS